MRYQELTEDELEDAIQSSLKIPGVENMPHPSQWKNYNESEAWVDMKNDPPFRPNDFLYSPVFMLKKEKDGPEPMAFYKRGVTKYRNMIKKGKQLPPVTLLWNPHRRKLMWGQFDGNHRSVAAYHEGLTEIPAVLGISKDLIDSN